MHAQGGGFSSPAIPSSMSSSVRKKLGPRLQREPNEHHRLFGPRNNVQKRGVQDMEAPSKLKHLKRSIVAVHFYQVSGQSERVRIGFSLKENPNANHEK